MNIFKEIILGIKLHYICKKFKKGRYTLNYNLRQFNYHIVLYNNAQYGVYAAICSTKYPHYKSTLKRLKDNINYFNK